MVGLFGGVSFSSVACSGVLLCNPLTRFSPLLRDFPTPFLGFLGLVLKSWSQVYLWENPNEDILYITYEKCGMQNSDTPKMSSSEPLEPVKCYLTWQKGLRRFNHRLGTSRWEDYLSDPSES